MKLLLGLVALLLLFTAVTLWRASQHERRAVADHPPAGQFIEVDGTRVHYVDEGEGPPVVLIHGASGNVNDWTFDMVGRLSDRYRVIAFDRPGLGYTDMIGRGAPVADQARLLADAAAALGADAPIVVGHSYGGSVALALRADGLSLLFALLITGIGTFIFLYAARYLAGHADIARFFARLTLFMGAMLGAVLADELIVLLVFWELTSLASFLLIGCTPEQAASRRSAQQGLLITVGGGLALLAGAILLGQAAGTFRISERLAMAVIVSHGVPALATALIAAGLAPFAHAAEPADGHSAGARFAIKEKTTPKFT